MKKALIFFIICFLWLTNAFAQRYFNRTYKDKQSSSLSGANAVAEHDGGYIVVGTMPTYSDRELILLNLKPNGDTIWQKYYGEPPFIHYPVQVIMTDDGFVVAGSILDSANASNSDVMLAKFDMNGGNVWLKRYGGISYDAAYDMEKALDGGFIITGETSSFGQGQADAYVIKVDSNGNKQWDMVYGGDGIESGNGIAPTDDKGYIISGYSFINGGYDHYIVKIDSIGNKEWDKTFGTPYDDWGGYITQLKDHDFLFSTASPNNLGKTEAKLVKLNTNGAIIWQKNYPRGFFTGCYTSAIENNDGSFVIGMCYREMATSSMLGYVMKVNSIGDTIWTKQYYVYTFGQYLYDLKLTKDNGFVFCGFGKGIDTMQNVWVGKIDCMGNDSIHYATENGCCGLYSANIGSNKTNATFCKGDSTLLSIQPPYSSYKWNNGATTQSIQVKQGGNYYATVTDGTCSLVILPTSVQTDTFPNPIIIKKSKDTLSSNYTSGNQWYMDGVKIIGAKSQTYTTQGIGGNYTVVVTNTCGTATSQLFTVTSIVNFKPSELNTLKVFPNPFSSTTTLSYQLKSAAQAVTLVVLDITGRKIQEFVMGDKQMGDVSFDAGNNHNGMYFCQLWADGKLINIQKLTILK